MSWKVLIQPIVRKLRLAAMLDMETRFNADGSVALAKVMEDMADIIDTEIDARTAYVSSAADLAFAILETKP
ncbi:MAG: hypothetical protein J0H40_17835 [Rhizobiales bacterium]|nr:hypothetical protein [Hyphomicrobiales bacterium]